MKRILYLLIMIVIGFLSFNAYAIDELSDSLRREEPQEIELIKPVPENRLQYSESYLTDIYLNFASNKYKVKAKSILQEDLLYSDDKINVRKLYPNPASNFAYVDYKVIQDIKAKITISNLLGKVVKEYELNAKQNKLRIPTMDIKSGVYFYTLSINGKAKSSKKLVIKQQ